MSNPKVSIIIPVYNGSNYLKEAIDSALNQTYKNIEVLVVNDGSNDNGKTEQIALSYGNKIRYFYKENGGVSTALNLGISKMEGEYFSWLSHDDLYLPEKIEKQINLLIKHEDAKIIFSDTGSINHVGETINESIINKNCKSPLRGAINYFKHSIYPCSLLVNKNCFNTIGEFNEKNHTTQDVEFILLLLNKFNIYYQSGITTMRRTHPESGFQTRQSLNKKEINELFNKFTNEYSINFFYNSILLNDERKISASYKELGDYILTRTREDAAIFCYYKSLHAYKSPLNSSLYKILFFNNKYRNKIMDIILFILKIKKYLFKNMKNQIIR